MKVGDLIRSKGNIYIVLRTSLSDGDPLIYIQSLKTGRRLLANKWTFEVLNEGR